MTEPFRIKPSSFAQVKLPLGPLLSLVTAHGQWELLPLERANVMLHLIEYDSIFGFVVFALIMTAASSVIAICHAV